MDAIGLIVVGLGIAAFGFFVARGLRSLGDRIVDATIRHAEEMRFRTRVSGGFELPPLPPPPPSDPRSKAMEEWLASQRMPDEQKDELMAIWEGVAGIRPAPEDDIRAWRFRLKSFGAPLPS